MNHLPHRRAIAFELQARFATEEPWTTLAVATTATDHEHPSVE